jgi:hypothetical protein
MPDRPPHEFDDARATDYVPAPGFVKTAILVDVVDDRATTIIRTTFGQQAMSGAFYIVDDDGASYGAARSEFEASHERTEPNRWRKTGRVRAYQVGEECTVATWISDRLESTVEARPGDWVVMQLTGELMALTPDAFHARYVAAAAER